MQQDTLATQVGGDHYREMKIQPTEFIHANGIGFIEGNIIKYLCRHKAKGGKQDLEKAAHYLQMLIAMEYPEPTPETIFVTPGKWLDSDGWIPWRGGKCPVKPTDYVIYKLRDQSIDSFRAGGCTWNHKDDDDDIIAYKLA